MMSQELNDVSYMIKWTYLKDATWHFSTWFAEMWKTMWTNSSRFFAGLSAKVLMLSGFVV